MQASSIQNVFDDMFKRFRSRSDITELCGEEKEEIGDIDQNVHAQLPEQNDSTLEVIEVCDSEDDCPKGNDNDDDVVFLRQTTSSESTKCGDNRSNCGPVDEIIVEASLACERQRRLSGESVRPSKTSANQKVAGGNSSAKENVRILERSSGKPKPKKKTRKQYLTYRTKKYTTRTKNNLKENSKNTRTKTKLKAQKSVAQAKKVLTKSLSTSKAKKSTTAKSKCNKPKGKRTASSKNKRTAAEESSRKATAKRKKSSARSKKSSAGSKKNGDDPLITKDMEIYEKDQDIGKTKRFFDVLDEVLKDDSDHSFGMLSFLNPPVPASCITSSWSHPITTLSESNSFFHPFPHSGNTIIKEN